MPGHFSLSNKNDTSLTLDLLRAGAAQAVCVGHALNVFMGPGTSNAPRIGVALFFVLSGFVIAHTLIIRSQQASYDFAEFFTERFARIYTAYLPALLLIALADNLAVGSGLFIDVTTLDWDVFLKNVAMLEGYPRINAPTYGSAGQLSSVALEFHIYIFVGAIYFAWLGRKRRVALIIAAASCGLPLAWLVGYPDPDRTLFWLWIAGFGAYLLASRIQVGREFAFAAAACFAALWFWHRTPGAEYAVSGYPLFALSFLALAMATQQTTVITLHPWLARPIKFAADYSFSLFLIHFTIEKIIAALWFGPTWAGIVTAVAISNLLSIAFAFACERRYRAVAVYLKQLWIRRSAAPIMTT